MSMDAKRIQSKHHEYVDSDKKWSDLKSSCRGLQDSLSDAQNFLNALSQRRKFCLYSPIEPPQQDGASGSTNVRKNGLTQ